MQILSLSQALAQAGIYNSDSGMEQDMKFASWIGKRQYRIIDADQQSAQEPKAQADGIEVLIIKEN